MRVALCQLPISSVPSANLARVEAAVTSAAAQGTHLAVFPEGTQARFSADLRQAAEPLDGPFCHGLSEVARRTGLAIAAGVFEPAPDAAVRPPAGGCSTRRSPSTQPGAGRPPTGRAACWTPSASANPTELRP